MPRDFAETNVKACRSIALACEGFATSYLCGVLVRHKVFLCKISLGAHCPWCTGPRLCHLVSQTKHFWTARLPQVLVSAGPSPVRLSSSFQCLRIRTGLLGSKIAKSEHWNSRRQRKPYPALSSTEKVNLVCCLLDSFHPLQFPPFLYLYVFLSWFGDQSCSLCSDASCPSSFVSSHKGGCIINVEEEQVSTPSNQFTLTSFWKALLCLFDIVCGQADFWVPIRVSWAKAVEIGNSDRNPKMGLMCFEHKTCTAGWRFTQVCVENFEQLHTAVFSSFLYLSLVMSTRRKNKPQLAQEVSSV